MTIVAPPAAPGLPPAAAPDDAFGPWNPGIVSQVPRPLRHLATIFRPENVSTPFAKADELSELTGLPVAELVGFLPQRLALHELLVRVTADFSVPDGSRIEDLGINFRQIVRTLHARCIEPEMTTIVATFDASRRQLARIIETELATLVRGPSAPASAAPPGPKARLLQLFGRERKAKPAPSSDEQDEQRLIADWERKAHASADGPQKAACAALAKVVSALVIRHGYLWGGHELMAALALDIACNEFASTEIGKVIEPWLGQAFADESYRRLPRQERPVVMNTKGPSASGKSTLRPLQKTLAGDIGIDWSDFALISPDIWRKQLLDYGTLGAEYKYGGAFTADEVQIVDQKLDRYMAHKALRGQMSHLLIDRFRFDSFAPDSDEAGSNLLTRFGHTVYLFFMITPPGSLVERAWYRGLDVGRYKAVDDTLAHGVDAYSGMPQLFFTWAQRADKRVHFEFLDNSVRQGERPRTVAFGWNDELNVLDVRCMLDVERYRRVNVDARAPEHLYPDPSLLAAPENAGFLRECVRRFRVVNFADWESGRIYLRVESGLPVWADPEALSAATSDTDTRAGLSTAAPAAFAAGLSAPIEPTYLQARTGAERRNTLGAWGPAPGPANLQA